jgi:hypothetical protein
MAFVWCRRFVRKWARRHRRKDHEPRKRPAFRNDRSRVLSISPPARSRQGKWRVGYGASRRVPSRACDALSRRTESRIGTSEDFSRAAQRAAKPPGPGSGCLTEAEWGYSCRAGGMGLRMARATRSTADGGTSTARGPVPPVERPHRVGLFDCRGNVLGSGRSDDYAPYPGAAAPSMPATPESEGDSAAGSGGLRRRQPPVVSALTRTGRRTAPTASAVIRGARLRHNQR